MTHFLTDEQKMIGELAAKIAEEQIVPVRQELDQQGRFPQEIMDVLAQADLFRVYLPEEYGGLGGGSYESCLVIEALSHACAGVAVSYAASALAAYPILLHGSSEQKERYLPVLASGEKLGAFAVTEAGAGSDAAAMETTASKDGDDYIIEGSKQWITNAGEADIYIVFAMTDRTRGSRGATAFIVEKGTPGFSFGPKEDKMGIRASVTRELVFKECRLSGEQLLGREGLGFIIALKTLDLTRPGIGAQAVGLAQGALDAALEYARQRRQFGNAISAFQAVQHMLAEMATRIEAARCLVYATARLIDSGAKDFSKEAAMAKVFASDVAMEATTDAVQIFGGYGYARDYPVEKMMRDAKVTQIYEGTNQILRNVIAGQLLKEAGREQARRQP